MYTHSSCFFFSALRRHGGGVLHGGRPGGCSPCHYGRRRPGRGAGGSRPGRGAGAAAKLPAGRPPPKVATWVRTRTATTALCSECGKREPVLNDKDICKKWVCDKCEKARAEAMMGKAKPLKKAPVKKVESKKKGQQGAKGGHPKKAGPPKSQRAAAADDSDSDLHISDDEDATSRSTLGKRPLPPSAILPPPIQLVDAELKGVSTMSELASALGTSGFGCVCVCMWVLFSCAQMTDDPPPPPPQPTSAFAEKALLYPPSTQTPPSTASLPSPRATLLPSRQPRRRRMAPPADRRTVLLFPPSKRPPSSAGCRQT